MGKYLVHMRITVGTRITVAYDAEVEANTPEEAKKIVRDDVVIDGENVSCEEIVEEKEGEKV